MRIIAATEAIAVEHPTILIVALPGIGRTSLGYSWNTLLYDFDQGSHRAVNRTATAVPSTWSDVDTSREVLAPYAGVTIDTVERCLGMLTSAVLDANPRLGVNGELYPKGWGELRRRFSTWLDPIKSLGKDVLLLAHAKETRDGERRLIRADIPGGSYGEVLKRADCVGYLSMRGQQRVLDFDPTDTFIGKNPAGWKPIVIPPAARAQYVMAELFDDTRRALGRMSEASAAIAADVEQWRRAIAVYTTAEEFTRAYGQLRDQVKPTAPAVYAQVYHLFARAAKDAGMKYEPEASAFRFIGKPAAPARPIGVVVPMARPAFQPQMFSALTAGGQ